MMVKLTKDNLADVMNQLLERQAAQGPWIEQICDPCARALGGRADNGRLSTYNQSHACDVCGATGVPVTDPHDWEIYLPIEEGRRRLSAIHSRAREVEGS